MNKKRFIGKIMMPLILVSVLSGETIAQEKIVFNDTIVWTWPLGPWYGGNSFYWWHRTAEGFSVANYGEMSPTDWESPLNFRRGEFFLRYEILAQPTSENFFVQLGIWQDYGKAGGYSECISNDAQLSGGAGDLVETSIGSPTGWWQKRPDALVDFTRPENFYRIGLALWKTDGNCLPMAQGWTNANACPDAANEALKFFPMTAIVTVVAVAEGYSFSGWENYTGGGGNKPPTPTYGIDYTNELTNKIVPSTDEYAYNLSMTGAVSGTGQKLALTPGQDVYFRTKPSGEIPASNIQILDVPARPAAPAFTYDATNQRTSTTVSSAYEYSSSATMSPATTGTGTYVSFPAGTTRYFRKKATVSAFKSNVQTLTGTSTPPTGNSEFVILNDIINWPNTTDTNGFYFFYYNSTMPTNWLTPYDFYNGQVYTRYEILSQATSTPVGLQFGIWQKLPPPNGTLYESMAEERVLNGPGSVAINNSSPKDWWKYNGGVDYTKMDQVWHFGINPWQTSPWQQIRQENVSVWNSRYTYWYPMQVRVIVVAVASGYTFSGWDNYLNAGLMPEYEIDYINEQTTEIVSSSDEYSLNQSSWTTGSNARLTLVPGQDVYFRKKISPTQIQQLDVLPRPAKPSFDIDYYNEQTTVAVSPEYQYAYNSNMSSASDGQNEAIDLSPGTAVYFRKKATVNAFASEVQDLVVPVRPAAPQIGIIYEAETTSAIPAGYAYSMQSDMSGSSAGNGLALPFAARSRSLLSKTGHSGIFQI